MAFSKLFQNLQIRSVSEAMAETVGSIMVNHTGKSRHLSPYYFDMELFLKFNMGPQHMLENIVEEVFVSKEKEYRYKHDSKGKLVTSFASSDGDHLMGSAIKMFRSNEESKSKLPLEF